MTQIFSVVIDNGYFFKHLIDFISLCVFPRNKCWLRFDHEGVKMQYSTEKQDDTQCYVSLFLERCNFQSFYVSKPVELQIEPKHIQKICRNVKKKDHLHLSFSNSTGAKFLLSIRSSDINSNIEKEEVKEIPFTSFFEKPEQQSMDKDLGFTQIPFTLDTTEIQNLKKAVGVKKEIVEIQLKKNLFLKFSTLSHGISPMTIKYGTEQECSTKICLSGNIINMLAKLTSLCKRIKFYEKDEVESDYNMIKIGAIIDIPQYFGKIDLYIYRAC
jgi:hypothetical protein